MLTVPFDIDSGCFVYKNKMYPSRESIFDEMYVQRDFESPITFYFHDDYFKTLPWHIDPPVSISDLYTDRAKKLREKYEYLILWFSGGTDSTEILYTFLDNNIFLDEVQIVTFSKLVEKKTTKELRDVGLDTFAEYEDIAKKDLIELQKRSPNTKITIIDATDLYLDEIMGGKFTAFNPKYTDKTSIKFPIVKTSRSITTAKYDYNHKNLNGNRKTAIVVGTEKPRIDIKDKKVYFNFTDIGYTFTKNNNIKSTEVDCTYESFYWSKDAPLIPIKQSHIIKKTLETDQEIARAFYVWKLNKVDDGLTVKGLNFDRWTIDRLFTKYIYKYSDDKRIQYKRESMGSSDFIASRLFFNTDNPKMFVQEYNAFVKQKYEKIPWYYLTSPMRSQDYLIGNYEPLWSKI
jgi:hypothetical protein